MPWSPLRLCVTQAYRNPCHINLIYHDFNGNRGYDHYFLLLYHWMDCHYIIINKLPQIMSCLQPWQNLSQARIISFSFLLLLNVKYVHILKVEYISYCMQVEFLNLIVSSIEKNQQINTTYPEQNQQASLVTKSCRSKQKRAWPT